MKIIDLISLFLLMVVSGGWIAVCAVFAPAYKKMSAATYIEAEVLNSKRACKHFAPALILATIFTFLSMLSHGPISSLPHLLSGASVFLIIAAGVFVKLKVLTINHEIEKWSPTAPPENWQVVRAKWIHYHSIRTVLGVAAFLLQAIAVIWW
jgi:hypothetical protein